MSATVYARGYQPKWGSASAYAATISGPGVSDPTEASGYIAARTCGGETAYRAVIAALELAKGRTRALEVATSSKLVYEQMTDKREIRGMVFLKLVQRVDALVAMFDKVTWRFTSANGQSYSQWPPPNEPNTRNPPTPISAEITLKTQQWGKLRLLMPIEAGSHQTAEQSTGGVPGNG